MTEEQVLKLHGIKGTLTAYVTIQRSIIQVAQESDGDGCGGFLTGYNDAAIRHASKAVEQHLVVLAEVEDLLREVNDG